MNIQAEKIQIIKMILETDNPVILESIKNIFRKEKKKDFWNSLSISQQKEIESGITEIENGEVVDYDEFMRKYR